MKTYVTTETGSEYVLDNVKMTWERRFETNQSGKLRTDGGELSSFPAIKLDEPMTLLGPPIVNYASGRAIITTPVVRITHESTGFAKGVSPTQKRAPGAQEVTTWGQVAGLAPSVGLAAGGQRVVDQAGQKLATTDKAKAAANKYTPTANYDKFLSHCAAYNDTAGADADQGDAARIKPKAEIRPRRIWTYLWAYEAR